jgi:outer membrane receptor for ferrienterochelin and colicins
MKKITLWLLIGFLVGLLHLPAFAQPDNADVYDLDFSSLSKLTVTTASKSEQVIGRISSSVRVVPGAKIQEKGYQTLDEVLADLPGFQFRNQMSQNSYIFQRGLVNQNNLMLVLIDGIPINELNSGGFYGGGQYNLANVDRIEVLYGPASLAYGTNAFSGVVNIITQKASSNHNFFGSTIGNFNTIKADFGFGHYNQARNAGIRLAGMARKTDLANLKGANGDNNWTDLMDNFENDYALDMHAMVGDWRFGVNYQQKQTSTATLQKSVNSIFKDYGTLWNIGFMNVFVRHQGQYLSKVSGNSTLYYRNATVLPNTVYIVTDTSQIGYYRPNQQFGFEQILQYSALSNFQLNGGLKAEYDRLAQGFSVSTSQFGSIKPPKPASPEMQNSFLISVFVEPTLLLSQRLSISGGVRIDHSSIYGQVVTPRVGLNFNWSPVIVRLQYADAFRAPKPWDYSDGLGNPDLLPEKLKSFEAAFSWMINSNFKFEASVYQNYMRNGFVRVFDQNSFRWENRSQINTLGTEVAVFYNSKKFESELNYTYNRSQTEAYAQIPEISLHAANLLMAYQLGKKVKWNAGLQFIGERENTKTIQAIQSKVLGPYWLINSSVNYAFNDQFVLRLTAKNLLDSVVYHTSNRTPDRYRQAQRTLLCTLVYSFNQ